jgi:hypothetical protein
MTVIIEITNALVFDDAGERARIRANYKPKTSKMLLKLLDAFLAQRFEECHDMLSTLEQSQLEYVHPLVFDVMSAYALRAARQATFDENAQLPKPAPVLLDALGARISETTLPYPKLSFIPVPQ